MQLSAFCYTHFTEHTRYYEMYSVLFPAGVLTTHVGVMDRNCSRVQMDNRIQIPNHLLIMCVHYNFFI